MFGFVLIFNQFVPFRFFLFIFVDSDVVLVTSMVVKYVIVCLESYVGGGSFM